MSPGNIRWALSIWLCALSLGSCTAPQVDVPEGALIVGVRTGPNSLDPRLENDEASARVAQLMFNTLFDIGDDLRPQPMLAERIENVDPLTYRVALRRGVRFHDGHELTARDVVFTYSQMIDPSFVSPAKGAYRALERVTGIAADDVGL